MVELVVAERTDPAPEEIRGRIRVSAPADIEGELCGPGEIWYGTHYLLRGNGIEMTAVCVSERYIRPDEKGRFLLYRDGQLIAEHATRSDVARAMIEALA